MIQRQPPVGSVIPSLLVKASQKPRVAMEVWKDYPGTGFAVVYQVFDVTELKNKPGVPDD